MTYRPYLLMAVLSLIASFVFILSREWRTALVMAYFCVLFYHITVRKLVDD